MSLLVITLTYFDKKIFEKLSRYIHSYTNILRYIFSNLKIIFRMSPLNKKPYFKNISINFIQKPPKDVRLLEKIPGHL